MFKFDLEVGSKGEWFAFFMSNVKGIDESGDPKIEYLDPEPDAGRFCIRVADEKTLDEIYKQTRKKEYQFVRNPKTRAMERVAYIEQTPEQEKLERELLWDHCIEKWENILDTKGNQIPCNKENKLKLMKNPQFSRFFFKCCEVINNIAEGKVRAAEKNS
jgi:hypothetical protein